MRYSKVLTLIAMILLTANVARADEFDFLEIVNLDTPFPGETATINIFGFPAIDDGEVVFFAAAAASGSFGVLYYDKAGALNVIADGSTPIPNGVGNLGFPGERGEQVSSIYDGVIAFKGSGSGGQRGIYRFVNGTLSAVADLNT